MSERVLCQSAVKMHVAAIHKQMLASNVAGPAGEEKYYHCGDFVGRGHALLERDLRKNSLKLLVWTWKGVEPLTIERRHHFSWDDRVHADSVFEQFRGPFPGEGENRTFRGSVT